MEIKDRQKKTVQFNIGDKNFIEIEIEVTEYATGEIEILYKTGDEATEHRHTSIDNHSVIKQHS